MGKVEEFLISLKETNLRIRDLIPDLHGLK